MIGPLWNLGIKVKDLGAEHDFLERIGAKPLMRGALDGREYSIVNLGGIRIILFPTLVFEDVVETPIAPGLTHAVFEVDDTDSEFERVVSMGAEILIKPHDIAGDFGSRRIAFLRSPSGFVFEIAHLYTSSVE